MTLSNDIHMKHKSAGKDPVPTVEISILNFLFPG